MQVTNHLNGEHLGERRPEQQRNTQFSAFDSLLFLKAGHGIAVNGMRDLMAERTRQLFGVLHKIQQ